MTDGFIEVTEGSGKKLQTFKNTVAGQEVHAEGVTLTSSAGAEVGTPAAPIAIADSGEREYTTVTFEVTASGDNIVYTPASGKKIRLHKICFTPKPNASTFPFVTVKLGAQTKFGGYMAATRQVDTGPVDGTLNINLSAAGSIGGYVKLEEV
jgi:hypothetical protein